MAQFSTQRRVEFAHTDMAGVAHFSEFFRYMESAEHEFFRSIGLSVSMDDGTEHVSWPRVACSFDFFEPLRFEDEFEIRMGVERLGEKSVTFRADVVRNGELCAKGRCTSVCCRVADGGRLTGIAIPNAIRAELEKMTVEVDGGDASG